MTSEVKRETIINAAIPVDNSVAYWKTGRRAKWYAFEIDWPGQSGVAEIARKPTGCFWRWVSCWVAFV